MKNLATRLDRLHAEMVAKRARDGARFSELAEHLDRMSNLEFLEFCREFYLKALQSGDAERVRTTVLKSKEEWLLGDNWKEEAVKRYYLTPEDIA